jgi:hypothetical protein
MSGGGPAGIVGQRVAKGNIAGVDCCGEPVEDGEDTWVSEESDL